MLDPKTYIAASCAESAETKLAIATTCAAEIAATVATIVGSYRAGGKVMLCGNGGSAADAQHLATEMMIRLSHHIERPALGAVSLCTDASNLTAGGNDIGFENIFARNVEGLGRKGDVLIGISTSGNSKNVILALQKARAMGIACVGFLGNDGGKIKSLCDVAVVVPSKNTQRIQEGHIMIGHIVFELVEDALYGGKA